MSNGMTRTTLFKDQQGNTISQRDDPFNPRFTYQGLLLLGNEKHINLPLKMKLPADLRDRDLRHLLTMAEYLTRDNALFIRPNRPMSATDVSEVIGINQNSCYELIRRLKDIDLVTQFDGAYYINPFYLTLNKRISPICYLAWKPLMQEQLSEWVVERFEKVLAENRNT